MTDLWRGEARGLVLQVRWEDTPRPHLLLLERGDEVRILPHPPGPLRVRYFGLFQLEATEPHNIFRHVQDDEASIWRYEVLHAEGWVRNGGLVRFELRGEFGAEPVTVAEAHQFLRGQGHVPDEIDEAAA
ncbi:MAG: hypothetical protein ACRDHO_02555 [Actinomycetota bacterium]